MIGQTSNARNPRMAMNTSAAVRAPPRPLRTRAATSPMPAARASRIGCHTRRNCGTPKSNSAWNVDRPTSRAPTTTASSDRRSRGRRGWVWPALREPSAYRIHAPRIENVAPPISSRCVGPHKVTSCPKIRCHMSSSGKAISDTAPQAQITSAPSGAHQPLGKRTAVSDGRRSLVSEIAITPEANTQNRPARMK